MLVHNPSANEASGSFFPNSCLWLSLLDANCSLSVQGLGSPRYHLQSMRVLVDAYTGPGDLRMGIPRSNQEKIMETFELCCSPVLGRGVNKAGSNETDVSNSVLK